MISCIVSTLSLEENQVAKQLGETQGQYRCGGKRKKIPFLSEIKLVLSTPQPVTQITMVCRMAISITLHGFYNNVVYKLQEVREE
jgi:hypothetical protein